METFYPAARRSTQLLLAVFWASLLFLYNLFLLPVLNNSRFSIWFLFLLLIDLIGFLWLVLGVRSAFRCGLTLSDHSCTFRSLTVRTFGYEDISAAVIQRYTLPVGPFDSALICHDQDGNRIPIYMLFLMSNCDTCQQSRWAQNLHLGSYRFQVNFSQDCLGYALYNSDLLFALQQQTPSLPVLDSRAISTTEKW